MRLAIWVAAAAFAAVGLAGGSARAEEWAIAGLSDTAVYQTDVASLAVKDKVVKSWTRETFLRPRRDDVTRKTYTVALTQRSDDCEGRQYALGAYIRRNAAGAVVGSAGGGTGWQPVVPGTVSETVWKANCAILHPPKEEALLPSISAGDWRSLGKAADGKSVLWVKSDALVRLDADHVLSLGRTDYAQPEWIDGYAVMFMVAATVVDCRNETSAGAGVDAYISPSLRVKALRVERADLKFAPVAPGSFMAGNLKEICASAKAMPAASDEREDEGFSTGTAWGVRKGYLVTAQHVVEDGRRIWVYRDGVRVGEAKVVAADPANDLAVLAFSRAPPGRLKVFSLAERGAALGRSIFTLGYPAPEALGQKVKMTAGQVSGTAGFRDDARFLQISVPIQGGNSGGPVIGWDGAVVGVVESKLLRFSEQEEEGEPPPENVNYAVKASYVRPMLEDLPDLGNYEPIKVTADPEQVVAAARDAVFMIVVGH